MLKMNSKVFTEVYVFIYVFIKFFTPLQVNLFTCVCAPSGGPVPLLSRGSDGLLPDARLRLHLRRHHGRQPHLQAGNPEDLHGLRVAHWQGGGRAGGCGRHVSLISKMLKEVIATVLGYSNYFMEIVFE